jgi:HD superfamily phosphodiesterase
MQGFTKEEMKILKKHFDADSRLKTLWEKSLPYQDVRGDGRHAENVVYFTAKLIEHEKDAEPQVALPAAIIHDIGWYWMTPQEHRDGLPYGTPPEILRKIKKKHEELGVKKSRKLLQESGYTTEEIKPIMEIVDGHDTRKEFLSPSDGIMRDADKLARFSKDGFWSEMVQKRGMTKEDKYKALLEQMRSANYFYSPHASGIAGQELEKRVSEGL